MTPQLQQLVNEANAKAAANQTFDVTGPDQAQCTAIPHRWEQILGIPLVYGNAKDTLTNADSNYYDKVINSPTNFPPPGAIPVWNENWGGGNGHTAVALPGCTPNTLIVLEQNDGDNGLPHAGTHDYTDVEGWYIPKVIEQNNVPSAPEEEMPNQDDINSLFLQLCGRPATAQDQQNWGPPATWAQAFYGIKDSVDGVAWTKKCLANVDGQATYTAVTEQLYTKN